MTIIFLSARKPRAERDFPFPALTAMARSFRERQADRLSGRRLDAVPDATLKDIGITRPEVFAGVRGYLNAA